MTPLSTEKGARRLRGQGVRPDSPFVPIRPDAKDPTGHQELRQQKITQTIKNWIDTMASTRQYVPVAAQTLSKKNGSRPVGRPSKSDADRRDNLVQGAFTDAEYTALLAYKRRWIQPNEGAALRAAVVAQLRSEGLLKD